MKIRSWLWAARLFIVTLFLTCTLGAQTIAPPAAGTATAPTTAPATATARGRGARTPPGPQSTTQPVLQDARRHADFLARAKQGNIDLLFTGDSITDFFYYGRPGYPLMNGRTVWDKYFGSLNAADFAVSGARTQNVIFQFQNGELEGFKAKCIVMMIGTNNISAGNTPEDTVNGIKAIIAEIQKHQPDAKLLLLGIFPRGRTATDPWRPGIKQVNAAISKLDDGQHIFYMDIGDKFLEPDGSIAPETMSDALHPAEKGYTIWAEAILPKVKELMGVK
jgi:lysophospholipase L1-like esterase